MARRRYQKGSLFLRGKRRKVWVGRYLEDVIENGQVRRPYRSVVLGTLTELPTRRLAARELERRLAEINSLDYTARPVATFAEFARRWQEIGLVHLKPSTTINYRSHLKRYLVPFFGPRYLRDIDAALVQRFIAGLEPSPRTVRNVSMTLRSLWRKAQAWGYVSHEITSEVDLPAPQTPERFYLTLEESRRIIRAADEPERTLYWLVAETGLRAGELCGLRIADLDLEKRVVTLNRSVWRGRAQKPKSHRARRTAAISPELTEQLRTYLISWRPNEAGYLFASRNGTPLGQDWLRKKRLQPLLKKLNIHHCGFHAFRHGHATEMDRQQVPLGVRQGRLGHADARLTLNTYTHPISADERRFVGELGRVLHPNSPKLGEATEGASGKSVMIQ
jgi:integrase